MPPVITALGSPAVRGDTLQVFGTDFGFVSVVAIKAASDASVYPVYFFVDNGESIHFTIPVGAVDDTYTVVLATLKGESYTSTVNFALPDDTPTPPAPGSFQANPIPDYTSAAMTTIRARARLEIGDYAENFSARAVGDGTSTRYDLPAEVIDPTQLVVKVNGATKVLTTDYTLDAQEGVLTLLVAPADGQAITAVGVNHQFFSDAEIDLFILSAALKHTHSTTDITAYRAADGFKYYDVTQRTVDTLAPVELHPVALLTAIEALEVISTDASFDISVSTAEGTSLGREERFQNINNLIEAKSEKYEEICSMLGVGLNRVEVFQLRRISRTTGRYVPVYRGKEYDDRSLPIREYVPIDSGVGGSGTEGVDPYYGGGGVWP